MAVTLALVGLAVAAGGIAAVATAVALLVDVARVPVYLATQGSQILALWPVLVVLTAGVVVGTLAGTTVLGRLPERLFRRAVGVLLSALGVFMALAGG